MACLLWEDTFYESGASIADRIRENVQKVSPADAGAVAIEARTTGLRHVPLLIARELCRNSPQEAAGVLSNVIRRADELTEFMAIYWKDGRCAIPAAVKRALAESFGKFNEYQLAKYNRDKAIKLRDVMRMVRPKPKDADQAAMWGRLIKDELATPDTWEVALSACGSDEAKKKEVFERLLREKKLGTLALIRNLRNMTNFGVDKALIVDAMAEAKLEGIFPHQLLAAARFCPALERELEGMWSRVPIERSALGGRVAVVVDVSGSMDHAMSSKSEMTRMDAACGVAIIAERSFEDVSIWSFSDDLVQVPRRSGFALRDAIVASQKHNGTDLGLAVRKLHGKYDTLIVITDEQAQGAVGAPSGRGFIVNVASYQNGVGYGDWYRIDGFSDHVVRYVLATLAG